MANLVNVETGEIVPTLASCEEVIAAGLDVFVEVSRALVTIRDERLYRGEYDTFELYCKVRWNWGRNYVNKLIIATEVVDALEALGTNVPKNEAQARELAPLKDEPERMAEVWKATVERKGGNPTAKDLREAVADIVREEAEKAGVRAEDKAANRALASKAERAGLDMDDERMRQRGEFSRLCRDLAALPDPGTFIEYQAEHLRDRHSDQAKAAHQWLSGFLKQWGKR